MDRLHRVIKKKRLIGTGLDVLLEEGFALVEKNQIDLFMVEVVRDHPAAAIVAIGMSRQLAFVQKFGWWNGNLVTVDKRVQKVGRWTAGRPVERVEPSMNRGVGDRS